MTAHQRSACEECEVLTSTWIDEGLDREDQRQLMDHLARCAECREFYLDVRALQGLATIAADAAAEEQPAPESWERIRSRTEAPVESTTAGLPSWAWRAAAALLLGVALAFAPWPAGTTPNNPMRQMDVVLEENRGVMTEGRFFELAGELLRADRRYHFAMQEVMEKVIDDQWETESSSSEGLTEDNADEGEGKDSRVRA